MFVAGPAKHACVVRADKNSHGAVLRRPPGRAPSGKVWDASAGEWVPDAVSSPASAPSQSRRSVPAMHSAQQTGSALHPQPSGRALVSGVGSTVENVASAASSSVSAPPRSSGFEGAGHLDEPAKQLLCNICKEILYLPLVLQTCKCTPQRGCCRPARERTQLSQAPARRSCNDASTAAHKCRPTALSQNVRARTV